MKKSHGIILSTVLISTMMLGTITSVSAADYGGSAATKGKMKFKENENGGEGEDGGNTVDPGPGENEKPKDPGTDTEPEVPGGNTTGALRIRYVPEIDFGEDNKIEFKGQTYYANFTKLKGEDKRQVNSAEVVDERGGAKGWSLSVSNDGKFTAKDGSSSFDGFITFENLGRISGVGVDGDAGAPTVTAGKIELTNDLKPLMTATKGQGFGSWVATIGRIDKVTSGLGKDGNDSSAGGTADKSKEGRNPAISVNVGKGQVIDTEAEYSTTLNWTLSVAP